MITGISPSYLADVGSGGGGGDRAHAPEPNPVITRSSAMVGSVDRMRAAWDVATQAASETGVTVDSTDRVLPFNQLWVRIEFTGPRDAVNAAVDLFRERT